MKKLAHPLLFLLFLVGLLAGCKKDDKALDDTIVPVSNYISPADAVYIKLDPPSNAAVTFEWSQARAADGTLVLYEVVFDKESGDFSKPVYSTTSGTNGLDTKLVLSHGDLNKIANLAGIAAQDKGNLKWRVNASKGTNVVPASEARRLTLERPAGFTTLPGNLYVTGSGTEAGATLAQAQQFKRLSAGVFEIYTKLGPGDVQLVDATTGTPTTYYLDGNKLRAGTQKTSPAATPTVYRLNVDFNNAAVTLTEVTSVGLWFAAENKVIVNVPYLAQGVWQVLNTPISFHQESWGRDERYKFLFMLKDAAGVSSKQYYGSSNSDNQPATATTAPAYFYLLPVSDSQYDYSYKFVKAADNKNVDLTIKLQPDACTHEVKVR